jgi:hypothetical protein
MFFDVSAQMQELVRDGTELDTDTGTGPFDLLAIFSDFMFAELFDQLRVLHQREAMSDALGVEGNSVVEVGVGKFLRTSGIQQRLAGVKHEWDLYVQCFARILKSCELLVVKPNVVGSIFSSYQVKAYATSERRAFEEQVAGCRPLTAY